MAGPPACRLLSSPSPVYNAPGHARPERWERTGCAWTRPWPCAGLREEFESPGSTRSRRAAGPVPEGEPMKPEKIGKYRILEQIGRGGMGTIYKAHDPLLDRSVAVKVISSGLDVTEEIRVRFLREAQASAQLSHPNIVTIYDVGEDDGQIFIVMELLVGRELKRVIAERQPVTLE